MPLIKICGVMDPKTARFAVECGADFIGIVFAKASKRCVSVEAATEIAAAALQSGAKPVGIFVGESAEEIIAIAAQTGISYIQAYELRGTLPEELDRFYLDAKQPLRLGRDFFLIDSSIPGSGQRLDWDAFTPPSASAWFLAGGLDADNVEEGILRFRPSGVDVSSGVETDEIKDLKKIQTFIQKVKGNE